MDAERELVRSLVKQPAIEIDPDATLREAAATLTDDYVGAVVVRGLRPMGASGYRSDGVLSERDIVRALAEGADPDAERVRNVMTVDVATASPGDPISRIAAEMLHNEIRHVPLVEGGVVVGVVSERDLLRFAFGTRQPDRA